MSNQWANDDLGRHCYAEDPHYNIHMNGMVDINPQTGQSDHRIELRVSGMFKMVNDWLSSGHQLGEAERKELIDKLSISGNRIYDTKKGNWVDINVSE